VSVWKAISKVQFFNPEGSFNPVYSHNPRLRTLASLAVCLGLTVVIVPPLLLLSISLARGASDTYQNLRDPETVKKIAAWLDAEANPILRKIQLYLPSSWRFENFEIGTKLGSQPQQIGAFLVLGLVIRFCGER
jgi:predicted PurR-regulated permease PerM